MDKKRIGTEKARKNGKSVKVDLKWGINYGFY